MGKSGKRKGYLPVIMGAILPLLVCGALAGCQAEDSSEDLPPFSWPESGICQVLPQPEAEYAELIWSDKSSFSMDVYDVTAEEYQAYAKACREAGFTVDAAESSDSYSANDKSGRMLSLTYWSDEKEMSIMLDAPFEEEPQQEAEEPKASDDVEKKASEPKAKSGSGNAKSESKDQSALADLVTPEFKETMDSYEAFFDEYIEFMEKYENSDDTTSMMLDLADYMEKYADFMAKIDAIDENELSEADALYYAEVSARIYAKLAEAGF